MRKIEALLLSRDFPYLQPYFYNHPFLTFYPRLEPFFLAYDAGEMARRRTLAEQGGL